VAALEQLQALSGPQVHQRWRSSCLTPLQPEHLSRRRLRRWKPALSSCICYD
jgi:hypothetical protein